jgi:hypothetical protein
MPAATSEQTIATDGAAATFAAAASWGPVAGTCKSPPTQRAEAEDTLRTNAR